MWQGHYAVMDDGEKTYLETSDIENTLQYVGYDAPDGNSVNLLINPIDNSGKLHITIYDKVD